MDRAKLLLYLAQDVAKKNKGWLAALAIGIFAATKLRPLATDQHSVSGGEDWKWNASQFPQYHPNRQGLWLHWRRWPVTQGSRGSVILVHGFGEHVGRYEHVAAALNAAGYSVFAQDHQGHGLSWGDRAHVVRFQDYVTDTLDFAKRVQSANPGRCFLLGHSMGGTLATAVMMNGSVRFDACILSAPALMPDPKVANGFMRAMASFFSSWLPKISLEPIDAKLVSRDPVVVHMYKTDPLVYKGGMRARWGHEMLAAMDAIYEGLASIRWPVLLLQGSEDKICAPEGARVFYQRVQSADKQLKEYEGAYHEIMNDHCRDQVFADIVEFLKARS